MLIYYDLDTSPNCLKIKILLTELGIAYDQRQVDLATVRGADYRAKFPTGMSPAIEDGDVRISESSAIAQYLAAKHGAFIPRDPDRRALMYQALSIEAALLAPTLGGQGLFGELYRPEAERNLRRIGELEIRAQFVAGVLGAILGDREYFAGELSIADFQLYAAVAKSLEERVFVDPPANLVAWCARMTARPSVAAARERYVPYRKAA
ncbi:MAG TPA: glutathione S-transferase family protein [Kofleriaceae bacterium]|jgi:glutathione S-transferase|nr:glutathione S-transferase family protein [Kofleriaceae bacterium]